MRSLSRQSAKLSVSKSAQSVTHTALLVYLIGRGVGTVTGVQLGGA
jgi:hypothetical protein